MKILVIDDNKIITENISLYLKVRGYIVDTSDNGEMAFDLIRRNNYDFLIIDRMMPIIDGITLVRMLQARSIIIPFLFLTALGKQIDKIEGLSLGADDYLVKPFDLEELVLRIENILKRQNKQLDHNTPFLQIGELSIDMDAKRVKRNDVIIDLSPKEYSLFEILIKNRGKILERNYLYEMIWGDYDVASNVLDTINVHIAHLRKKLGNEIIRTVKLAGYIID